MSYRRRFRSLQWLCAHNAHVHVVKVSARVHVPLCKRVCTYVPRERQTDRQRAAECQIYLVDVRLGGGGGG